MLPGQLTDSQSVLSFAFAGNATFTIRSQRTGVRYTFKVRAAEKRNPTDATTFFVSLLTGPSNEADFTYLGIVRSGKFLLTKKSSMKLDTVPVKAFAWTLDTLNKGRMPNELEVWHEGTCGRCGRKLTVPESIASGIGPECAKMAA